MVTEYKPTDGRKPNCPYCGVLLRKIPGAKTRCPTCGFDMYVRTDPHDSTRKVITKEMADKFELDWAKKNGTYDEILQEKARIERTREVLLINFKGQEPSTNDVVWRMLIEDSMKNALIQNWGLYRNTLFQMAEIVRKEKKYQHALHIYLQVCYIDLNGPQNLGGMLAAANRYSMKLEPFKPNMAFLAPGVLERILKVSKRLSFTKNQIEQEFLNAASQIDKQSQMPKNSNRAWKELSGLLGL